MTRVYLSLGSNIGPKKQQLDQTLVYIKEQVGTVLAQSTYYVTEPWKMNSSHHFLNAAVCVHTELSPLSLLFKLQEIEKQMGRIRKSSNQQYEDRIIDIDILLYDHIKIHTSELTIPHPFMWKRPFVLKPLTEIYPQLMDHKLSNN